MPEMRADRDSVREEPSNLVTRACAAAFEAVQKTLAEEGATLDVAFISLNASGQPGGEPDSATAMEGNELHPDLAVRSKEVVAFLVSAASEVGKQVGIRIMVIPAGRG